jgi:3-oxoacyl-[acyl-carrier-protein] synthase II
MRAQAPGQGGSARRVVVIGIGAITPIGHGRDGLWRGVQAGQSAVRRISRFDPAPFRSQVAAEVDGFDPLDYVDARRARRLDRCAQFALAASRMAVADAGLRLDDLPPERVGVLIGSALGGVGFAEEQHRAYLHRGVRDVNPALALLVFGGAAACIVAIELGVTGPVSSNGNSCAAGATAIGDALNLIRSGTADVMLAGGAEAPLAPLTFGAFDVIHALSTANHEPARASRPFDRRRDGFVMGEGAAVLMLEERTHALARGAHVYAELVGYALTNDAHHMTAPRPDGASATRAVRMALDDAQACPEDVDYVCAHGSSTPLNDSTETMVLKQALGEHASAIPVSGTKGLHAHALGASGAIEAAICSMLFGAQWVPPTTNLDAPDPACDLDFVPQQGRPVALNTILSTSFGFGGINVALVLRHDTTPS